MHIDTGRPCSQPAARILGLIALLSIVGGCGTLPTFTDAFPHQDSGPLRPIDVTSIPDAIPKGESPSKYGNPPSYIVDGKRYYVLATSAGYTKRGIASWYGTKFHGNRTSSGEPYDMYAMTAAHKTLPLPTYAEVTNLLNGQKVIVKINDRGPFKDNREIDLSYAAATKLGFADTGTGIIELRAIDPATFHADAGTDVGTRARPLSQHNPDLYLQIGAFSDRSNAERLISRLSTITPRNTPISLEKDETTPLYRVRIGPIRNVDEADRMSQELALFGVGDAHIVID